MSVYLVAYRHRSHAWDVTITDASGSAVVFETGDVFRVKVGRSGEQPILDLDSLGTTSKGSGCTAANPSRVTIHQDDLLVPAGAYDVEVDIVDKSDGSKIKAADKGVLTVIDTQLGDVGVS